MSTAWVAWAASEGERRQVAAAALANTWPGLAAAAMTVATVGWAEFARRGYQATVRYWS